MFRFQTLALSAFLLLPVATAAAHADTVTFTINNPTQGTVPGGTLSFSATVAAPGTNTGLEYLNGDSFNVGGSFTLDDSSFVNNFPLDLTPGQSFTGVLFTLADPLQTSFGTFTGSFSLLGGSTASSMGALASAPFAAAVTPEPSGLALLGTGLLGLVGASRRQVRSRRERSGTSIA